MACPQCGCTDARWSFQALRCSACGYDAGEHLTLRAIERLAIQMTLRRCGGRLEMAARTLGISRTTLWRRLRDYRLQEMLKPRARGA